MLSSKGIYKNINSLEKLHKLALFERFHINTKIDFCHIRGIMNKVDFIKNYQVGNS